MPRPRPFRGCGRGFFGVRRLVGPLPGSGLRPGLPPGAAPPPGCGLRPPSGPPLAAPRVGGRRPSAACLGLSAPAAARRGPAAAAPRRLASPPWGSAARSASLGGPRGLASARSGRPAGRPSLRCGRPPGPSPAAASAGPPAAAPSSGLRSPGPPLRACSGRGCCVPAAGAALAAPSGGLRLPGPRRGFGGRSSARPGLGAAQRPPVSAPAPAGLPFFRPDFRPGACTTSGDRRQGQGKRPEIGRP